MRQRQLLSAARGPDGGSYGSITVTDGGTRDADEGARSVLRGMIDADGLEAAVDDVMANGWANQSLYFGEVVES